MSSRLSTHPAFGHPVPAIDWLAPYVNAAQVTLPSGAKVPLPMLFWRSRALVLYGLADADAVDGTALHDTGRTAARLDPPALGLPHGGSKALVQIWAPDYTGTTVGPIKAVFGSIIVVPTRKEFALLPHNWWWWYYGNSIVNQEFKREVWGVPNKIGMFDMFYDRPQKVVRLLEDGYVALRLECDLSHVTGEMDVTAPPDPAAPGGPPKPLPFRTVARRKTDDSENLVEILGRKLLGSSPLTMIPYQEGRDTFYCAPGATVGRALRDIDFTPVMWDFFTEYAGVVHLYDRHGRGEPATEDRDHQIAETIAQAIADALRHLPKP